MKEIYFTTSTIFLTTLIIGFINNKFRIKIFHTDYDKP
jgi:hypothetical protein